jgi:hypothetical protein
MTKLLEKAIHEASKLSPAEQDGLAAIVLEELASDERWAKSFASSQDALASLTEEALRRMSREK